MSVRFLIPFAIASAVSLSACATAQTDSAQLQPLPTPESQLAMQIYAPAAEYLPKGMTFLEVDDCMAAAIYFEEHMGFDTKGSDGLSQSDFWATAAVVNHSEELADFLVHDGDLEGSLSEKLSSGTVESEAGAEMLMDTFNGCTDLYQAAVTGDVS